MQARTYAYKGVQFCARQGKINSIYCLDKFLAKHSINFSLPGYHIVHQHHMSSPVASSQLKPTDIDYLIPVHSVSSPAISLQYPTPSVSVQLSSMWYSERVCVPYKSTIPLSQSLWNKLLCFRHASFAGSIFPRLPVGTPEASKGYACHETTSRPHLHQMRSHCRQKRRRTTSSGVTRKRSLSRIPMVLEIDPR